MATYKEIKGVTIQTRDEDPTVNAGTWASTPSLNAACREGGGSGGPTTAINVGGYPYPMTSEHWNGSTWATFANMGTPRAKNASAGSYTNAIVGNGSTPSTPGIGILNVVESWNGSAWSEITEINSIRDSNAMSAGGTNTAVIYFGGNYSPGVQNLNEKWNGASWTVVNTLNAARSYLTGIGTSAAALAVGGSPDTAANEEWNGTSWTEKSDLNTARDYMGGSSGTQTSAVVFGGDPGNSTKTESWNGASWTEVNDLATGRDSLKGAGTNNTTALAYGGYTSTDVTNSEEFSFPSGPHLNEGDLFLSKGTTLKGFGRGASIPSTTWASGGDVNNARSRFGGATNATQTAGLIFGSGSSPYGQTEEYNGSTWAEQTDLNTGRYIMYGGGGTQTACITAGGYNPAGSPVYATTNAETYNGASWTNVNTLNEGRLDCATFGTSTSAILVGGGEGPGGPGTVSSVESWNGASWTATTSLPATRQEMGAWGSTSTAGAIVGGTQDTSPTITAETLEWNGSAWTAGGDYPSVLKYTSVFGSLNSAIVAGGENATAIIGICAHYDGSSWTEVAEMTTARMGCSGNG